MKTQMEKAHTLKALHEGSETFVAPGPWDIGSARLFEALGKAIERSVPGPVIVIVKTYPPI